MFINKTISNKSILHDHVKLYFLVTIPILLRSLGMRYLPSYVT